MRGRVQVAGSANLDFVVRAAHVPAPGETVLGREFARFPGGKGANQAVASARAGGASTRMLLALGDDPQAGPIEDSLRGAGVELQKVRSAQPTGVAFVCLADNAENAITVAPGANADLRPEHLPDLADVDVLLMQLETPLASVQAWATAARAAGVRTLLNAAPAPAGGVPAALLAQLDLLIVNEGELAAVAATPGAIAAQVQALAVPGVVVTLGARGCYARLDGQVLLQPAFPVQPVDTTGAGDTFCGALAAELAAGVPAVDALRFAAAAGALACTRLGAQTSVPQRAEVEALLAAGADREPAARQRLADYCGG